MTDNAKSGFAFARISNEEKIITLINVSQVENYYSVPVGLLNIEEGRIFEHLTSPGESVVENGAIKISLPPLSGIIMNQI
jgi:hypothetical protein